jgi:hypothetical protein
MTTTHGWKRSKSDDHGHDDVDEAFGNNNDAVFVSKSIIITTLIDRNNGSMAHSSGSRTHSMGDASANDGQSGKESQPLAVISLLDFRALTRSNSPKTLLSFSPCYITESSRVFVRSPR